MNDTKKQKNILDAYIDKKGKCIIYIYGYPCTSKTQIGKLLAEDINLPHINANQFIDGFKNIDNMKIYEHSENMQWDKLKDKILETSSAVITCNYITDDLNPDFVYFIGINKTLCKENLLEFNAAKNDDSKYIEPDVVDKYITNVLFPMYDSQTKITKINKFINIKENSTLENIYNTLFDQFVNDLQDQVNKLYDL